jgi:TolB-like protein
MIKPHTSRYIIHSVYFLVLFISGCASRPAVHTIPEYKSGSVVAVWNLEHMSVKGPPALNDMNEFLTAKVSETLKDKGGYQIIERERLLLALEELHLGSSALADETSKLEVGKILGAQLMVFGGYQQAGDQFRIDLRMIEVQSGAVVRTGEKTVRAGDISGWLLAAEDAAAGLL